MRRSSDRNPSYTEGSPLDLVAKKIAELKGKKVKDIAAIMLYEALFEKLDNNLNINLSDLLELRKLGSKVSKGINILKEECKADAERNGHVIDDEGLYCIHCTSNVCEATTVECSGKYTQSSASTASQSGTQNPYPIVGSPEWSEMFKGGPPIGPLQRTGLGDYPTKEQMHAAHATAAAGRPVYFHKVQHVDPSITPLPQAGTPEFIKMVQNMPAGPVRDALIAKHKNEIPELLTLRRTGLGDYVNPALPTAAAAAAAVNHSLGLYVPSAVASQPLEPSAAASQPRLARHNTYFKHHNAPKGGHRKKRTLRKRRTHRRKQRTLRKHH